MKNLKNILIPLGFFIFIIAASIAELHYMRLESVSIMIRMLLLTLFNLNLIALLTLMFYVGKNLARLYIERKHKVLGYKFKTKIVVMFVVITLIPAALLFFVASGLVTNYIDRLLTPQFRQPLTSSLDVAKSVYEMEREKTTEFAKTILSGEKTSSAYKIMRMNKIPENPTETIKSAFEGREGTEVISEDNGDIIRAVMPEYSGTRQTGIVVVETRLPKDIQVNVEKIKSAYEDYIKLESWKVPLKMNYLLILAFFTLIIVFMSLWAALRIAKGITDPIQSLAQATEEVAKGNLRVKVEHALKSEDEIGLLITSFNSMVSGLREGKEKLQNAYMESDRRRLWMENILKNINSGVVFLDISGNILTINDSACSILNVKTEEITGKNYKELMSKINSEELHNLIKGIIIKDLKSIEREVKITVVDKHLTVRVFVATLRESNSKPTGLLVVFDDLTDVIRAKETFVWEEATRRIAHEIKNPLTPIKLSTERMIKKWEQKDKDFGQIFERSTKTIVKEVDSLKRLVDEYSRLGKMPEIKKTPVNLAIIIDEVIELYKDHKGFNIMIAIPDDMPPIEIDGEQFKRVLINIFENAFQAMGDAGNIEIKVLIDKTTGMMYIDIADDGLGISEEDKGRIFRPYFSTKKGGTGLGLAIANKIVKGHRGSIMVRDNVPQGTIFTIQMPIQDQDLL
ncbi:MAG: PAS domain-containing protein [Nitrospirae bacterium]|nr:PAS domain-containing protein [Nitrospirota bacterium]